MPSILEIDLGSGGAAGTYRVKILRSPAGEASAKFDLMPGQILDKLGDLQQTLLASSVPSRRLMSRSETVVREIGERLFNAIFSQSDLSQIYRSSCDLAAERGDALRIVLRLSSPELAALPWESMFDSSRDSYVSRREPLVRHVQVASSPSPLKVELPLKVLGIIASPRGPAPLDVEKERDNLTSALAPMLKKGAVALHWVEHATWSAVQETLLSDAWHIVHFVGHGDFDTSREEGILAFESDEGRVQRVPAESFVDLLREAQPMPRLVVLNACESSSFGQTDIFSGVAAALIRGGVNAVTAMQFEISDRAALAFCRGFYTAIGRGRGVDEAVRSGRVAIVGLGTDSLEWITPTLYLRGEESRLFSLSGDNVPRASKDVAAEQIRQAADALDNEDPATAVAMYDSALAQTPNDDIALKARAKAVAAANSTLPQSEPTESASTASEAKRLPPALPPTRRPSTGRPPATPGLDAFRSTFGDFRLPVSPTGGASSGAPPAGPGLDAQHIEESSGPAAAEPPSSTPRLDAPLGPSGNALEAQSVRILQAIRLSASTWWHIYPDIPAKKLTNARFAAKILEGDTVLALADLTVFGSAKDCFLFTTSGVFCKFMSKKWVVPYPALNAADFQFTGTTVTYRGELAYINSGGYQLEQVIHAVLGALQQE